MRRGALYAILTVLTQCLEHSELKSQPALNIHTKERKACQILILLLRHAMDVCLLEATGLINVLSLCLVLIFNCI